MTYLEVAKLREALPAARFSAELNIESVKGGHPCRSRRQTYEWLISSMSSDMDIKVCLLIEYFGTLLESTLVLLSRALTRRHAFCNVASVLMIHVS